jgi:sialidase-1
MPDILTVKKATPEFPRHSEATVLERRDGSLLMAWQEFLASEHGGEDNGPNRIATMVSRDGGNTWGEPKVFVETAPGDVNVYSPSFVRLRNGDVLFFNHTYHRLAPGQQHLASGMVRRSRDDGETWSEPTIVFGRKPAAWCSGVGRELSSGRIIMPLDLVAGAWPKNDVGALAAMFSDDGGRKWRESRGRVELPMRGAMEGHIEELKDGRLLIMMRTQLGSVFQSFSTDGGDTWSKAQTTGLRAPESCPDINRIPSTGDLAIVWNDSEYDPKFGSHYGKRSPLSIAVSRDEGKTWSEPKHIETDPEWAFSNPGLWFFGNGRAMVTYWACPYTADWLMDVRLLDLKAALFDVSWLYA